ncbi:MCE family protein [Mycobacterium sp. AZCC_0083]|uniref:MCE family protein n=1 Tax=Mycobacterium sp. AZCC_0083 TaxID=2735882 RepID=UPI001621B31C|nr:MCE family protein [Mycobacterium sp. AZCC_0083]MBB5163999.1 phospholipid/cholesterol/gamma-HCH transport system substrate-binding protein [Mycobacterium sp. AZCC_0083]
MKHRTRVLTVIALIIALAGGVLLVTRVIDRNDHLHLTTYFANSNGIFVGDDVRVLGVPVGKIDKIEPEAQRVKIAFWVDGAVKIPQKANAVVISPSLVSARAIQLTPAYNGGAAMTNDTVIPQERTAVPIEWDELRQQLKRLTDTLQPRQPGGVSSLGSLIDTTADNLRGQGTDIHDAITKMSQAFSALGDHSSDLFSTIKNISVIVSALQASHDLLRQLNENLAAVTGLLTEDPGGVGTAVAELNAVVDDVRSFTADNKEAVGTTSDKLASITTALNQSLGDIKQALHVAPNTFQNFINIYQPAQATLTGALAASNFANPLSFICGAIQAASRLNYEQSAKLCVQYLAPIVKNRQYNFPPLGENLFVGAAARPNERTYSEDWLRPDYVPPAAPSIDPMGPTVPPLAAESPAPATDPGQGLQGMMVPSGSGS